MRRGVGARPPVRQDTKGSPAPRKRNKPGPYRATLAPAGGRLVAGPLLALLAPELAAALAALDADAALPASLRAAPPDDADADGDAVPAPCRLALKSRSSKTTTRAR